MLTPLLFSLLTLQFPVSSSDAPAAPARTKVLAHVNGQTITAGDIEKYLWDWDADTITETFVSFALVEQEAKRQHVTVSPLEVKTSLDEQLAGFKAHLPPGSNLEQELRKRGYPPSRIYLTVKNGALLDKIVLNGFRATDFTRVSTLIVKPKSEVATDVSAAANQAQAYYEQLKKGDPWEKVLAASTTDANVLSNKGLLGWRSLDAFPPVAQGEMRSLKPGEFTHPVQTAAGIQIFKLENNGNNATPDELKELRAQFLAAKRPAVLKSLRDNAKITKP